MAATTEPKCNGPVGEGAKRPIADIPFNRSPLKHSQGVTVKKTKSIPDDVP